MNDSAQALPQRYCLGCDYPLTDSAPPACSECGRDFDPANPATWSAQRLSRIKMIARVLTIVLLGVLWVGSALSIWSSVQWQLDRFDLILFAGFVVLPIALAVVNVRKHGRMVRLSPIALVLIALPLILLASVFWKQWPAILHFKLIQDELNALADNAQSTQVTLGPYRIGWWREVYVEPKDSNSVEFNLERAYLYRGPGWGSRDGDLLFYGDILVLHDGAWKVYREW